MDRDTSTPGNSQPAGGQLVFNRDTYDFALLLFERLAIERGYGHWRRLSWRTGSTDLGSLTGVTFRLDAPGEELSVRFERDGALGLASLRPQGHLDVWLAALSDPTLTSVEAEVRAQIPLAEESETGELPVRFWTADDPAPASVVRNVAVPAWHEVAANYPDAERSGLARLMAQSQPPGGGQLMLWHGAPGTGKTYAIRALLGEWRTWLHAEYVVDPERFFGGPASYLMSVLLGEELETESSDRWRLLIFEDTGELLSADAKDRAGQGLSRLLNTVDGLLGQGLKVLVLITTNDELGRLHPAVTRPGRCAVNLRFPPFDQEAAASWLAPHGKTMPRRLTRPTLADLFAIVQGTGDVQDHELSIGFRRG